MSTGTVFTVRAVTLGAVLFVDAIVLRLFGFIDWPWLWVLAPVWLPAVCWFPISIITALAASRRELRR